jgi:hypothetical protein
MQDDDWVGIHPDQLDCESCLNSDRGLGKGSWQVEYASDRFRYESTRCTINVFEPTSYKPSPLAKSNPEQRDSIGVCVNGVTVATHIR